MTATRSSNATLKDYTQGSIASQMLCFALPHMLSSALQIMYSAVDLSIVGRAVSGAALSGVSVSSHVLNLLTMLGLGFATGGQVYMSQLLGAGKKEQIGKVTGTLFTAMLAVSATLAVIAIALHRPILRLMNTPPEAYELAVQYLLPGCVGMIFTYSYNCFAAIMRAAGDSKTPMYAIAASSVINLALDVLFVVCFRWGVPGAIAATVIGQAVSALTLLVVVLRKQDLYKFSFTGKCLRPDAKIFKTILFLAVPYALEMGVFNISMLFVSSMVNSVGLYASEAFGIGLKVEEIGNKICTGITCATAVMTGQSMAAGKIKRTQKIVHTAWAFGAAIYVVYAIVCILWSRNLFSLFVSDAEVIELAPMFISALSWGFPAMASMRGTNGLMQGVSNARLSFIIGIIDGIAVRIPLSYILGVWAGMGLYGFFLAYSLAAYTNAGLGMLYYLSGRWKKRKLAVEN